MTQSSDMQTLLMAFGEMRGQLSQLVNSTHDNTTEIKALRADISELKPLPAEVSDLKNRVAALEAAENKREGAQGALGWLVASPLPGWIIGAIGVITVWFSSKAH
jgi:hypothetical protein